MRKGKQSEDGNSLQRVPHWLGSAPSPYPEHLASDGKGTIIRLATRGSPVDSLQLLNQRSVITHILKCSHFNLNIYFTIIFCVMTISGKSCRN